MPFHEDIEIIDDSDDDSGYEIAPTPVVKGATRRNCSIGGAHTEKTSTTVFDLCDSSSDEDEKDGGVSESQPLPETPRTAGMMIRQDYSVVGATVKQSQNNRFSVSATSSRNQPHSDDESDTDEEKQAPQPKLLSQRKPIISDVLLCESDSESDSDFDLPTFPSLERNKAPENVSTSTGIPKSAAKDPPSYSYTEKSLLTTFNVTRNSETSSTNGSAVKITQETIEIDLTEDDDDDRDRDDGELFTQHVVRKNVRSIPPTAAAATSSRQQITNPYSNEKRLTDLSPVQRPTVRPFKGAVYDSDSSTDLPVGGLSRNKRTCNQISTIITVDDHRQQRSPSSGSTRKPVATQTNTRAGGSSKDDSSAQHEGEFPSLLYGSPTDYQEQIEKFKEYERMQTQRKKKSQSDDAVDEEDVLLAASGLQISSKKPAAIPINPYLANARTPKAPPLRISRTVASTPSSLTRPIQYPTLLDRSIQHDDLRAKLLLAYWRAARPMTIRSHERPRLEIFTKKVVRLALTRHPLRSIDEYLQSFGKATVASAPKLKQEAQEYLDKGGFDRIQTPSSRYGNGFYSITEACLVVLYEHARSKIRDGTRDVLESLKDKDSWISLEDMLPLIDAKLRPECPAKVTKKDKTNDAGELDNGAAYYMLQSTRSVEFGQISKLECELGDDCGPRIKRHKKKGSVYYELLEAGYVDAEYLRGRSFPAGKGHYRTSSLMVGEVQPDYEGICIGVDRREGSWRALHHMCGKLDMCKVPYFVGSLAIGDYVFFTGNRYLCPIIVERKSIEDVASSIVDGRWISQKARMYKGQYIFGYNRCRMVYIIEGNENKQLVTGGYIGSRWQNIDKARLYEELDNLEAEGFAVMRTPSRENTMFELSRWAKRIAKEIRDGTLTAKYTYQEFKDKLKLIPQSTDFSRLAKYHAAQAKATTDSSTEIETNEIKGLSATENLTTEPSKDSGVPSPKRPRVDSVDDEFAGYSIAKLKALCKSVGVAQSGTKAALIERYKGPHPPKLWLERKKRKQFVPERHNVAGTALLVALYLHETKTGGLDNGLLKDDLYMAAEELCITKNPFSGGTTQTGPFHYDGWSSMASLLKGDPALVLLKKKRYKLTRSGELAGYPFAKAMHRWCHEHGNCPCGDSSL